VAAGGPCSSDAACTSGICVPGAPSGVCAIMCSVTSDCPAGEACFWDALLGNTATYCVATCDNPTDGGGCSIGACRAEGDTQGNPADICDPRSESGPCTANGQCFSNLCTSVGDDGGVENDASEGGTCVTRVGVGQPCSVDSECLSGWCGIDAAPTVCAKGFGAPCGDYDTSCGIGLCCSAATFTCAVLGTFGNCG
jgi:hypothetical protein